MTELVTLAEPRSPAAEAYRSLRTNLAFARPDGGARVLVVTSAGIEADKSATLANLAVVTAQSGLRVVVVDAVVVRLADRVLVVEPRQVALVHEALVRQLRVEQFGVGPVVRGAVARWALGGVGGVRRRVRHGASDWGELGGLIGGSPSSDDARGDDPGFDGSRPDPDRNGITALAWLHPSDVRSISGVPAPSAS